MEVDWEFEIASDAPIIDAAWPGFIDLRTQPRRVSEIREQSQVPALQEVLLHLNEAGSGVFTSKCDAWNPGATDADELDADYGCASHSLACYIDLLPVETHVWPTPERAAAWARSICATLAEVPVRSCRIDLVIRRAFVTCDQTRIGITCYFAGCGSTDAEAAGSLARALRIFSSSVTAMTVDQSADTKLQSNKRASSSTG